MFYYITLLYINSQKSVGGIEEQGQNKFDRDSEFSGGSLRNGGRQVCFITLFFFSILQNMLEEWRERDRTNLTETLNSQEGAGGTEEDKYVLLH